MRLLFSAALSTLVAVAVSVGLAQDSRPFSGAQLTAHPTTSWPTNGGNLFNQRYSPLKTINRTNVAQLKGVWRARLRGSGTAPQYSGFAAPLVYEGVKLDCSYRMDLVVENCVIVEVKAVAKFDRVHEAQMLSYLQLADLRVGLILNFNVRNLTHQGVLRMVNEFPG